LRSLLGGGGGGPLSAAFSKGLCRSLGSEKGKGKRIWWHHGGNRFEIVRKNSFCRRKGKGFSASREARWREKGG